VAKSAGGPSWKTAIPSTPAPSRGRGCRPKVPDEERNRRFRTKSGIEGSGHSAETRRGGAGAALRRALDHQETKDATSRFPIPWNLAQLLARLSSGFNARFQNGSAGNASSGVRWPFPNAGSNLEWDTLYIYIHRDPPAGRPVPPFLRLGIIVTSQRHWVRKSSGSIFCGPQRGDPVPAARRPPSVQQRAKIYSSTLSC